MTKRHTTAATADPAAETTQTPSPPALPMGPYTRFPGKMRTPVALCLTPELAELLKAASKRLALKRGDVLCELIKQYASTMEVEPDPNDRKRLKALRQAALDRTRARQVGPTETGAPAVGAI